MKKWSKPEVEKLDVKKTAMGGRGPQTQGVGQQEPGGKGPGEPSAHEERTSAPSIDNPKDPSLEMQFSTES